MRLYREDEKFYGKWQKKVYRLFRKKFSVRHYDYLLDDPEFMHDLLSVIEHKAMQRTVNIGEAIAGLRRMYRRQSSYHRATQFTENSEHYIAYDETPEKEVIELKGGDDE